MNTPVGCLGSSVAAYLARRGGLGFCQCCMCMQDGAGTKKWGKEKREGRRQLRVHCAPRHFREENEFHHLHCHGGNMPHLL